MRCLMARAENENNTDITNPRTTHSAPSNAMLRPVVSEMPYGARMRCHQRTSAWICCLFVYSRCASDSAVCVPGAQANMVISWHRRSKRGCMENSLSSSTRTRRFASPCTGTRRIPAPRLPTICDENPSCWRNAAITFTSLRTVRSEHPSLPAK